MGLFGSLFTGVSSLGAQSQATAIIANNIANVNTVGFKRSDASFFSLVTSEGRATRFSPGTVSANRLQLVDQQGAIVQTLSSTDAAISGNGMFAVKRDSDDSALTEYLYTRSGQFTEDAQGFLKNSGGFFLYGWPIDANGLLPANQGDLDSLVPVDVAFLGGLTRPTSTAELSVNLDSRTVDELIANLPTAAADFQRGLTVFDSLGNPQPITFTFTKSYGPGATKASTIGNTTATTELIADLGLADGDIFEVDFEPAGGSIVYEVDDGGGIGANSDVAVQTIGDIISDINSNVAFTGEVIAFIGNNGELVIQRTEFTAGTEQIILTDTVPGTLASLGLTAGAVTSDDLDSTTFDNGAVGDTPPYSGDEFPAFRNLPGDPAYNGRGWWQLTIRDPANNVLTNGMINFNGDGTINAVPDNSGNIDIELNNIDWGNGSDDTQGIDIDISRFSQFASDFSVLFSDQNGAELGLRTGVEIDREGFVIARFSNGATSALYKLPLVTFANPNGLQEISGTAYSETEESGEENLREAGTGGAGFVESSTLENSNVDLADEFAKLIISQRAFSASTRVISTVDELTEELLRLR